MVWLLAGLLAFGGTVTASAGGAGFLNSSRQAGIAETVDIEDGRLHILNPYRLVDWDRYERRKSNLHCHSKLHKLESDGSMLVYGSPGYEESDGVVYGSDGTLLPHEVIDVYREYGFDILAITDHDPFYGYGAYQESYGGRTTYPWSLWDRDPEALNMIAIEGQELTNPHGALGDNYEHDVSLFNDLGKTDQHETGYDREERLQLVSERGGLLVLAHPRGRVTAADLAEQAQRYRASRHIEVFTRSTSTDARRLWDEVLGKTMPFFPVWGVSVDDMHRVTEVGLNYCMHLLPDFHIEAVRHSLEHGEFYFTVDPSGNDPARHAPVRAPVINRIEVEGTEIRIFADQYDSIAWISMGQTVATGEALDVLQVNAGNYVRAELHGDAGAITCTQPFGIIREVECGGVAIE